MVQSAGSIFLGEYTPETLGDYMAGPNHTLPTSGAARYASPLGVYDFIKRPSYLSFSKDALSLLSDDLQVFANLEGLSAHANAVKVRCP
ncbi:Histidinol dehydrogenase like protein [Aduncisulcus paluster]|uniref:Histidinol dehydrogenase like protein n=1 Tax=Aduncisulcus paluster TaxID=2918883 RepID=A0ABQ5K2H4_9EUKA|nr:Histidinol dehydrogenase like protein [Aduncisulcus paluster]